MADGDSTAPEVQDLRDLPAPEPLLRALEAADALQPGQAVVVLTPLLPRPLLDALDQRGLRWQARDLGRDGARIQISRAEAP